jgi:NTE family protein
LNGGGSRGAYEIGAWQALDALGVRFDGVYGTSIGALNAALFAQGDLEGAVALWSNITVKQIMVVEDDDDFAVDRMIASKRDVIPFLRDNVRHFRMDISPLEEMVRRECDEGRVRASGMNLGLMTFRVPQMQGLPVFLRDMAPGTLSDWVIASASCFPIFPAKRIGGQRYIDGGYCDNLPLDMALADGADEVVAVELHPYLTHPEYARLPWLTIIKPRHNLGGFLDFNPRLMARSLRMGYQDVMKRYGRFDGWLYTFRQVNALAVARPARHYLARLTRFDAEFMRRGSLRTGQPVNAPMLTALEAETAFERLDWKDVWLRGLELCAEVMGYREDAIYDAEVLIRQIRRYCDGAPLPEKLGDAALHAAWKQGPRQTFATLSRWLIANGDFPKELWHRLGELPRETAGAMFMAETGKSL